jgi:dTDP-4-amino-4,6-dideoxygalactose transaminase
MKIEVSSPAIRRKEMAAVLTTLVEERLGPGEEAEKLIATAKEKLGFDYCIALRSPAYALRAALVALLPEDSAASAAVTENVADKPRVLLSALSPAYYAKVLEELGLKAVYCDVSPDSACLEPDTLRQMLPAAALLLYHPLGYLQNTAELSELGVPIIEDISTALGSGVQYVGDEAVKLGNHAVFTILGLEERDMITAGGGALLYARDKRNGAVLRNTVNAPPEYCLADMNAAMASVQFKELERNMARCRQYAEVYTQAASGKRHKMFAKAFDYVYNNYAFPLVLESGMKDVKAYASKKEIEVEEAFGSAFQRFCVEKLAPEQFPCATSVFLRTALFPIHARLGADNAARVARLITTLP